jgi:crotonobetainyl-CoA:carnitine CoA-transferase CaiB-like acyl-CoA transferase
LRRGKASIWISPEVDSGRAKVLDLISDADLVVDNFSARVMPNWGLSYGSLKKLNPRLVQVRMTAFGLTGPLRHWVAYAPTLHAWSGHTWLFGRAANGALGGEGWPIPFADLLGAAFGLLGALTGLFYARCARAGTLVDLSQYECAVFGLGPIAIVVTNPSLWPECFSAIREGTFQGSILSGVQG